jgi:hypothetical protein
MQVTLDGTNRSKLMSRRNSDTDRPCETVGCGNPIASWNRSGLCSTCYEDNGRERNNYFGSGGYGKSTDWGLDIFGNLFRLHGDV